MLFRCTKKAQGRLRIGPRDLADVDDDRVAMTEWYCNAATLVRRPHLLLTHAKSLFSFWMPVAGNAGPKVFGERVREYARNALLQAGVTISGSKQVIDEEPDAFAKTRDRRVLGSMNDFVFHAKYRCEWAKAHHQPVTLFDLNDVGNRMPMSAIRMERPYDEIKRLLGAETVA